MQISSRVKQLQESITLKLNEQVGELEAQGKTVFNLTAGQLPFHPPQAFVTCLESELKFLKSYQYAPVTGFPQLKGKVLTHLENSRGIALRGGGLETEVIVSTGAKQVIFNALGAILNPSDEVIILAPYWISYPEMIQFWGGKAVVVESDLSREFIPSVADIAGKITSKTKAILVNSPNNPSGNHYPISFMKEFATLMKSHPEITIISDEIYYDLSYFDPKPTYYYQEDAELLKQTLIVEGISKSCASTGLRLGYGVGPKSLIRAMSKLQGQSTSSANSHVQRALIQYDWALNGPFLKEVCDHLRKNSQIVHEVLGASPLERLKYKTMSAFYYLVDFTKTPMFQKYAAQDTSKDYSMAICSDLLDRYGVALVPGGDFGVPNCGRFGLVLNPHDFEEAMKRLRTFCLEK